MQKQSVVKKEYYPLAQFEEALLHAGGGLHCCFWRAIDNTRLAGLSLVVCVLWFQSCTKVLGSWDTFVFVRLFSIQTCLTPLPTLQTTLDEFIENFFRV